MHRGTQVVGLLFSIAGFIIIVTAVGDANQAHFAVVHAKLGLFITVAARCVCARARSQSLKYRTRVTYTAPLFTCMVSSLQPLNSLIWRPKPAGPGASPTLSRVMWEMVHKTLGYGTVILAWFVTLNPLSFLF
jgi:hypothetical protein